MRGNPALTLENIFATEYISRILLHITTLPSSVYILFINLQLSSSILGRKVYDLRLQYVADIKRMGEDKDMAYVSFIEEYFRGEGRIEGMREGISEGRLAEKLAAAARMRSLGMAGKDILKVTELPLEKLNAACPQ